MIINFHPKEKESKKGVEIIGRLNADNSHTVFHVTDKNHDEWKSVIDSGEKIILVAPVYWWGGSYEFDRWAQNVLHYGYAYQYNAEGMPEGLLKGREFELHMTHGTPTAYAAKMLANIKERMEVGIFGFCDSKVAITFYDLSA